MRHADAEELALAALGEDIAPAVLAHLATCEVCAGELESLRRVVDVGRATTPDDVPADISPTVWERVHAELGLGAPSNASEPIPLVPRREARQRVPVGWVGAAAAAGIVLGAVGAGLWASREPVVAPSVLAQATLEPLPGWEAAGSATVEEDAEGRRAIVVDVDAVLAEEGFREVWLIAPDLSGMVSLGPLDGAQGRFTLPEGLDLSRFPVVDVSQEPFDGDATHSGDSIVRGALDI